MTGQASLGALAQEIVALIEPHLEALMPQPAALPQTPIAPIPPPHLGGNVTESGNGTTQGSQNSRGFSVTLPLSALSHKKD